MKTVLITLTYLVGIGELVLAGYFWKGNAKNEIRRIMAFLSCTVGLWVLSLASNAYAVNDPVTVIRDKLTFILGLLLLTTALRFSIAYPFSLKRFDWLHNLFLYLPCVIFGYVIIATNDIIAGYHSSDSLSGEWIGGPLYRLYALYLLALFIILIVHLLMKRRRTDGIQRADITTVAASILFGGSPGAVLYLLVPLFTNVARYPLIGALSTVVWLGMTAYIVVRRS